MNRYPVYIKYHNDIITRKTTQDTLHSQTDVKSMIIQAFPQVKEEHPLHIFWTKSNESANLYPLLSDNDYLEMAHWHKTHYQSFINVYDSMNDIILIDKQHFKDHLNKLEQLLI
ncbi:hypothetical protein MOUN0_O02102 [Monosporozyma unispora]|nr:hypothetical protein C6P44_000694 [Kazachstania unispora]